MDITKCEGTNCPLKEKCYRFTAPADDEWQSYFTESPYGKLNDKDKECEYFWFNGSEPRPINRKPHG